MIKPYRRPTKLGVYIHKETGILFEVFAVIFVTLAWVNWSGGTGHVYVRTVKEDCEYLGEM